MYWILFFSPQQKGFLVRKCEVNNLILNTSSVSAILCSFHQLYF
jgi:hypothetical protein